MIFYSIGIFLLAFLIVASWMSLLWVIYYYKGNAGIVDLGYALGFIWVALTYFFLFNGKFSRKILLLVMVVLWAGRLFFHLLKRFQFSVEDPRYTAIIGKWTGNIPRKVYFLFLFQAFFSRYFGRALAW